MYRSTLLHPELRKEKRRPHTPLCTPVNSRVGYPPADEECEENEKENDDNEKENGQHSGGGHGRGEIVYDNLEGNNSDP